MVETPLKWSDKHRIFVYDEEKGGIRTDLTETISPLSKFALNLFSKTQESKRNLILILPTTQLNLIPLLSATLLDGEKKDILVFGKKETIEQHIKNYCLLNYENGRFLFYNLVPFELSEDKLEIKLYLPLANKRGIKTEIEEELISNPSVSKIYFSSTKHAFETILNNSNIKLDPQIIRKINEPKFKDLLQQIIKSHDFNKISDKHSISLKFNPNLIIFENIDETIRDEESLNIFLEWLSKSFNNQCNYLFHFSNPYTRMIELFKIKSNSLILDFNPFFLRKFKSKFINPHWSDKGLLESTLKKYEIDNPNLYTIDYDTLPMDKGDVGLEQGNLDIYYGNIIRFIKDKNLGLISPRLFNLKEVLYELYNLCIHPSNYLILQEGVGEMGFSWISLEQYFDILNNEKKLLSVDLASDMEYIIRNFKSFYLELKRTRRFFEEHSYNRPSKNCVLLDLLKRLDQDFSNSSDVYLRIGVRSRIEKRILWRDIERLNLKKFSLEKNNFVKENLEICTYSQAMHFHSENSILILGGPPRDLRSLCKIFNNNKKILFIVYKGFNYRRLKQMLASFNKVDLFIRSITYLDEFNQIGLKNNMFSKAGYSSQELVQLPEEDAQQKMSESQEITISYSQIKKHGQEYELELENYKNDGRITKIITSQFSKFICIKNETKAVMEERTPRNLENGDLIIFFGDQRKEILDLFCEIENLNVEIDLEEIKIWRNKLSNFIEEKNISYTEFYELYKEKSDDPKTYVSLCNWITNRLIGPDSYKDIESISKVLDDTASVMNASYISQQMDKIRKNHISIGKKVNRILKSILDNTLNDKTLDYEGNMIIKKIKLYRIKSITKIDQKV